VTDREQKVDVILTWTHQAQNSPFPQIFFHHSLLAPTWTAFSDLYWTGLTRLNGFPFLVYFFFLFWFLR